MRMERVKGIIEKISGNKVVIVSEKSGEEFTFSASDFPDPVKGEKVDLLCAPSDDSANMFSVISIKSQKKIKPLKMPNFNTLVGHMVKTRDRLKATLAEAADNDSEADLNEKISWLNRGISLFS